MIEKDQIGLSQKADRGISTELPPFDPTKIPEIPPIIELDTRIEDNESFLSLVEESLKNGNEEELKSLFTGAWRYIFMKSKEHESYDSEQKDTPEFTRIKDTYKIACVNYVDRVFIDPYEQTVDEESEV